MAGCDLSRYRIMGSYVLTCYGYFFLQFLYGVPLSLPWWPGLAGPPDDPDH